MCIGQFGGQNNPDNSPATIASEPAGGSIPENQDQLLGADGSARFLAHDPQGGFVLEQQYSAIPSDIVDILNRLGQRIERRQVRMPVQNGRDQGGRRDALPVEEIEIVPVRWETY